MESGAREVLLGRLRERIVAYAASHIGRDVAEDLAQETLMLLEEKYAAVERMEDLLPLSLQIVRFKMTALRRKAARRGEYTQAPAEEMQLADPGENPAAALERKEMLERLERAVAQLGERCRELLRLKLEGRSFSEIQKAMHAATLNTVYTWDHRCRRRLLELMGGAWEKRP
jgi:RNA polymerase sigma-70 factor (ECF subfamily)